MLRENWVIHLSLLSLHLSDINLQSEAQMSYRPTLPNTTLEKQSQSVLQGFSTDTVTKTKFSCCGHSMTEGRDSYLQAMTLCLAPGALHSWSNKLKSSTTRLNSNNCISITPANCRSPLFILQICWQKVV